MLQKVIGRDAGRCQRDTDARPDLDEMASSAESSEEEESDE